MEGNGMVWISEWGKEGNGHLKEMEWMSKQHLSASRS